MCFYIFIVNASVMSVFFVWLFFQIMWFSKNSLQVGKCTHPSELSFAKQNLCARLVMHRILLDVAAPKIYSSLFDIDKNK